MQNGIPIPVYGDGMQIRDWLYVTDHCEAIHRILLKGTPGQTYNIGGNNQPPNIKIVRMICHILDETYPQSPSVPHEKLIKFVPTAPA